MEYLYQYRDKVNGRWISEPVDEQRILEFVTRGTLTPYDFVRKVLHVGSVKEDDLYQYRDKANGHWISEPVNGKRIQELVTQGTLTSDDFLREAGQMIRNAFPEAEKHWAKLRRIRVELNKLWEAQLDSLMSKITNPDFTRPEAEPSFYKFRSKENAENLKNKLEKGCVSFWNDDVDVLIENSEPQKILQKAIKRKIAADCLNYPEKFTLDGLSGEVALDQAAYESKRKKIKDWLCASGFSTKSGVYIFYNNEKPLYVGETALRLKKDGNWSIGTFNDRFFNGSAAHFTKEIPSSKDKGWSRLCTKIRIFLPKSTDTNAGIQKTNAQEMERLLILKYDLDELDNKQPGTKKGPIDDILSELESEIDGLCDDGELLKKDVEIEHLKKSTT